MAQQVLGQAGFGGQMGQPGMSPLGGSGPVIGGGPIVGVASISKNKTIRVFSKKDHYDQWQFIYDPTTDTGGLLTTPNQPTLQAAGTNMQCPPGQTCPTAAGSLSSTPGNIPANGLSTVFANQNMNSPNQNMNSPNQQPQTPQMPPEQAPPQ